MKLKKNKRRSQVVNREDSKNNNAVERIKHPLQHSWSFWFFSSINQKENWDENLVLLSKFDTVEDYWCIYHHMKLPSELENGQEYYVFKSSIRPMWEDEANKSGGRWLINFDSKKNTDLDSTWLYVVLLMIGENYKNSDAICGAVLNCHGRRKIGIWLSNAKDEKAVLEVGHKLKDVMTIDRTINFHAHRDNKNLHYI